MQILVVVQHDLSPLMPFHSVKKFKSVKSSKSTIDFCQEYQKYHRLNFDILVLLVVAHPLIDVNLSSSRCRKSCRK